MTVRTWLITGVSSGFGRELTEQLLARGERVVGTVRRPETVADLAERYADTFRAELLDVTEASQVRDVVDGASPGSAESTSWSATSATASSAPPRSFPTNRSSASSPPTCSARST